MAGAHLASCSASNREALRSESLGLYSAAQVQPAIRREPPERVAAERLVGDVARLLKMSLGLQFVICLPVPLFRYAAGIVRHQFPEAVNSVELDGICRSEPLTEVIDKRLEVGT